MPAVLVETEAEKPALNLLCKARAGILDVHLNIASVLRSPQL